MDGVGGIDQEDQVERRGEWWNEGGNMVKDA